MLQIMTPGGGGGGDAPIEQHTASNSASLDFTASITALYDSYLLDLVDLTVQTNNVNIIMQYSSNGGSSWDTSNQYYSANYYVKNGLGTGTFGGNPSTSFILGGNMNSGAGYSFSGTFHLHQFASTSLAKTYNGIFNFVDQGPFIGGGFGQGFLNITGTAYNAFKVYCSSGNIVSGVARLYGMKK